MQGLTLSWKQVASSLKYSQGAPNFKFNLSGNFHRVDGARKMTIITQLNNFEI